MRTEYELELEKKLEAALAIIKQRDDKIVEQQAEIEKLKKEVYKLNKKVEEQALEITRKNNIILLNNYNHYFSNSEKTKNVLNKARSVTSNKSKGGGKRGRKKGTPNHQELDGITPDEIITLTPKEIEDLIKSGECIIIGEDCIYKISKNPESFRLTKIVRPKYLYNGKIYQAPADDDIFGKSIITSSFVSNAINFKFCLGMSINKLSKYIKSQYSINISNQSWCDYFKKASNVIEGLYERIKYFLVNNSVEVMHVDGTTVSLSKGKDEKRKKYYFLAASTTYYDHTIRFLEYLGPREISSDIDILSSYHGTIVCDGFQGYDKLDVRIQRCWVHARRYVSDSIKIHEVKKVQPQVKLLEEINKLFEIEEELEGKDIEVIRQRRSSESKKVLNNIKKICESNINTKVDSFKTAIKYILNHWEELCLFLSDPYVPIHNNQAERTIGYFAQARKNFQTICSEESAVINGKLFTVSMTAQANGLDVEKYFNYIFEEIHKGTDVDKLLPWNKELPDELFLEGINRFAD